MRFPQPRGCGKLPDFLLDLKLSFAKLVTIFPFLILQLNSTTLSFRNYFSFGVGGLGKELLFWLISGNYLFLYAYHELKLNSLTL